MPVTFIEVARASGLAFCLSLASLGACTPTKPPPKAKAPPTANVGVEHELRDAAWDLKKSQQQRVGLRLPEASHWRSVREGTRAPLGTWWSLVHAETQSELQVRRWRAIRQVRVEDCERELSLWKPELADTAGRVERAPIPVPLGQAVLVTGITEHGAQNLQGYAVAVWAVPRACIAACFSTTQVGARAEETVADRLALFARSLATLRELEVEDRARREPQN